MIQAIMRRVLTLGLLLVVFDFSLGYGQAFHKGAAGQSLTRGHSSAGIRHTPKFHSGHRHGVVVGVTPGVAIIQTPKIGFRRHFHGSFAHTVIPRRGGVFIIGVPHVVGTSITTYVASGVAGTNRYLSVSPRAAEVRSPGQLAPFDPTPQEVVERMLRLAGVKTGDVVYDLGSGDGRVVIMAAKQYGVKAVGFEIDPGLVKLARENVRREGVEHLVEIRQQDFLTVDLSPASVVTLYLSNDGNLAVRPALMNRLKPGARVVSYSFDMGDWPPKITESYRDAAGDTHLLYLWQISDPMVYGENPAQSPEPTKIE
ncbi:MAG TPA: methyltransferase domain-containing protein [Candidatus Binatia bacterium]|nr:methyltransferase domain-containing protein [Candidatus Binatia bacterium]